MPCGFSRFQIDETTNVGSRLFIENETKASVRFDSKPPQLLSTKSPVSFNGATISRIGSDVHLSQPSHMRRLCAVLCISVEKSSIFAERARRAYIAAVSCPDLSFCFSTCSQYGNPDDKAVNRLNKFIKRAKAAQNFTLSFVPLKPKTTKLTVFTDASFANNPGLFSQLGYVLVLYDDYDKANI